MSILSIAENLLVFISGFGILQGTLLSILILFHPKSDRTVNKFLAIFILCLSLIMTGPMILNTIGWRQSFFLAPMPLLAGPTMYLYVRSFKENITWRKALPHLLLFFTYFFTSYWWFSYLSKTYPMHVDFPKQALQSPVGILIFVVRYIHMLLYYFLSRRALASYQKSIRHLFSETSTIELRWVKWLINGYLVLILVAIMIYVLMARFPGSFYFLYLANIAVGTPYIYLIAYKGILHPTLWQKQPAAKEKMEQQLHESGAIQRKTVEKQKNSKAGLSDDKLADTIARVIRLMEEERLYQEPELTLQAISDKLDLPYYQVSQAINDGLNKSFYDLVNGYRVEEAKRLLSDPQSWNYTILSVGFEAGFNSKTTFNTVFKKFTGRTPTDFREQFKTTAAVA